MQMHAYVEDRAVKADALRRSPTLITQHSFTHTTSSNLAQLNSHPGLSEPRRILPPAETADPQSATS
ncbi:hypothetical protein PCANC_09467 [Puccinia coronata f. sp. avenae]|uniref:Uncharacterized protein n=1 Tax=Puccinia coronata f. sp. avenae TaxID=200324 RepID=A0A2N5VVN3_9BASI|nr:hypothetical protein PCANC_09467 [Puccinia coronata f. sp. avenae]